MIRPLLVIFIAFSFIDAHSQPLYQISEISIPDYGGSNHILIGDYIFSVDNLGDDKYAVIDISNPDSPQTVLISNFGFDFEPYSMVLDGNTLYIGASVNPGDDKTLVIMDVSNPQSPVVLASYLNFPFEGKNFKVTGVRKKVGNYLFCAAGTFNFMSLDVSDPANVRIVDGFGDGFTGTILSGVGGFEVVDANNGWLDNDDLRHVAISADGTFAVGPKQDLTGELYDMQFNQAGTLGFAVTWQLSAANIITLSVSGQTVTETNVLDVDDIMGSLGFGADLMYLEERDLLLVRDVVSFYVFDVSTPESPQYLESYVGEGVLFRDGNRLLVDGGVTADFILYSFEEISEEALTADFTGSPTTVMAGGSVEFSFSGTGTPQTYAWTFEGGTPASSTEANPSVTYAVPGAYTVTLQVTGNGGISDTATKEAFVTVEEQDVSLNADFTADTQEVIAGGVVKFTDVSTGSPVSWNWTFEGGTPETSTLQNPEVTYAGAGIFTVSLQVTGSDGSDTETKAGFITVYDEDAVVAKFVSDKQEIFVDETVKFTDTSLGSPESWTWTFEGGTPATSAEQNPEVTYSAEGEFSVTLVVQRGTEKDTVISENLIKVSGEGGNNGGSGAEVTQITELWAAHIPMEGNDEIVDIAVDNEGNIYAAGFASKRVNDRRVTEVVVLSANADGGERYYSTVTNNGGWQYPEDEPWTIAVDDQGNAYITAGLDKLVGSNIPVQHNLISFDAEGNERWRVMTGEEHSYSQYITVWDDKLAILLNEDAPSGPSTQIASAITYSTATGEELNKSTVNMGQGNVAIGLYVDMYGYFKTESRLIEDDGTLIFGVTHAGTGANGRDIHLRSVSPTGEVLSYKIDSDRSFSQDELISLKVDSEDNIYVLARLANTEHTSIMSLIKLSPQLSELWRVDVEPNGFNIAVTSMNFDSEGNILMSGSETYPRLVKVTPEGELLWDKLYNELDSYFSNSFTVYVSPSDKIILAAGSRVAAGVMSFILLDKNGNVTETYGNDYENGEYENFINKTVYVPSQNAVYAGGWSRAKDNSKSLYYAKYGFPLKSSQSITFDALDDVPETTEEVELIAVASSGLPVTYQVEGPATLEGNKLVITGPGLVTATALQNGDSDYTAAEPVVVSFCVIASKPTITAEEKQQGVLLTSSAANGHQWYLDAQPIPEATGKTFMATESGYYQVRVILDGCEGELSAIKEVEVSPLLGLPDAGQTKEFNIYPNPVREILTIEISREVSITGIGLYNVSGQQLNEASLIRSEGKIEINLKKVPEGIYILKLATSAGEYSHRIVKQ